MTTYAWPVTGPMDPPTPFWPKSFEFDFMPVGASNGSAFSGGQQGLLLPGTTWQFAMGFGKHNYVNRTKLGAFLRKLNVREHRVQLFNFTNPVPSGTCNVSGVTASVSASASATSMTLAGCGAGKTLNDGDMVGVITAVGNQLLEVCDGTNGVTTADGSGFMVINFRQMLRGAVAAASAITLTRPTALFVLGQKTAIPYGSQGVCPEFSVTFNEVFA